MDKHAFGRLLREARQRSLLTLENLAEASAVSVRAISDMERGKSLPRPATLNDLLDALGLDEDQRRALVQASARRSKQVPRQLPPDLAAFRGREEALTTGHELTSPEGRVAVSAISGMAGVGKTTLAVHWAHQVAERFPDGQLYVNLRGFENAGRPLDPGEALGGFLRALGVPSDDMPTSTGQRSALFREETAARKLIVVLDNARSAEQVRPLLPDATGCLTIITSRDRLTGLTATEGVCLIGLDVWSEAEALAALSARIGDGRCHAEPEAAAELVGLCGYLPLAVALVGAQLSAAPRMPLSLAVRELRGTQPRLDALSSDDQRVDVRAVFSRSYQALTPEAARFFRYLSVHPGPAVSVEAAASVAALEMPAARRHLRELDSAGLLSRDADGRYTLHDLVRAYGTELFDRERDDRLAAETRLLDYLHHNARTANRFVTQFRSGLPDDPAPGVVHVAIANRGGGLSWFRQEEPAATAALRAVDDARLRRRRINLAQEWVGYNAVAGRWSEEITASRIALDAALRLDDPIAVVRSSRYLARALVETGRVEEADEPVDLILDQLHRLPVEHRATTERNISWVHGFQSRHTEALEHARRGLAIARELHQRHEIALALIHVGWSLCRLGDHHQTIAMCRQAIPMLRDLKDSRNVGVAWDNIGYAQHHLGDLDAAVVSYRKAIRIYQGIHSDYGQAEVLDNLASAQLERGETEQARESWTRAADLFGALRVARASEVRAKAEALRQPGTHPSDP
ncbi:tetratricopeptide repeat protein [Streptomyces olivaceoviridis]|uniref:tetratricopeptide repeat protein n=1 Tax=Streptomyces olivaceoviridis TaxID=1921 RepID=UPI0036FD5A07